MPKTIRIPDFEPTNDMKSAARAVFFAMAYVETIRPIVKKYQHDILKKYKFRTSNEKIESGRRLFPDEIVTDREHVYMLSRDDFNFYLEECRVAQKEAGLKTDSPDHCPLLVAESILTDARTILCEAMEPFTKVNKHLVLCSGLDNYRKYIDLSLKLLAPFVDAKI